MDIAEITPKTIQAGPEDIIVINMPKDAYISREELESLQDAFSGRFVVILPPGAEIKSLGPEDLRMIGLTRLQ